MNNQAQNRRLHLHRYAQINFVLRNTRPFLPLFDLSQKDDNLLSTEWGCFYNNWGLSEHITRQFRGFWIKQVPLTPSWEGADICRQLLSTLTLPTSKSARRERCAWVTQEHLAMERPCTVLINYERSDDGGSSLRNKLENGDTQEKVAALKEVILLLSNGHRLPQVLMTIIRFIMPMKDKTIKKLLLLYWEVCEKTDQDGKLLHEMILVW